MAAAASYQTALHAVCCSIRPAPGGARWATGEYELMYLQAIWHCSSLYLWACGAAGSDPAPAAADGQALPHPTAQTPDALRALLGDICTDALIGSVAAADTLTLLLPADELGPLPPGGRGPTVENSVAVAALAPYVVPALRLGPTEAVDLLVNLIDPLPEGCGDSVRYWQRLARFVVDRLAAQQFFPEIAVAQHGQYVAHWRLLVTGERDADALEQFAAAMPPVCMAIADVEPELRHPHRLVETFLHTAADALIRRDVSIDPFFNRAHEKAAEALSPPEVRWLSALLGSNRQIRGDVEELNELAEQTRTWIGRLDDTPADASMRLAFELIEPDDDDDQRDPFSPSPNGDGDPASPPQSETRSPKSQSWRLRFLLESMEDDVVVPAAELWKEHPAGILGRTVAARRQRLTTELSRAADVFPLVQTAIETGTPDELLLSTLDAHVFIRQWGPLLQEHGFGVRLPDWTMQRDREIGLLLRVDPVEGEESVLETSGNGRGRSSGAVSAGGLGLDQLLQFDWQIAVGDLTLSVDEFRELAARNTPLVKYRGQWIHLEPDAAQRALAYLDRKPRGRITLAEAFASAYGATRNDTGLPVLGLAGVDWIDHLLRQSPGSLEALDQPPTFQGQLRPYQKRGLQWLAFLDRLGIGACLADDMGLGKTIQLIALLLHERYGIESGSDGAAGDQTPAVAPTLLFAPTSVVGNWTRELQRFAPSLKVMVHHGPDRLQGEALAAEAMKHDIVITSYSLAHRDAETLSRGVWRRVVLDEAQKIKNPSAASTQAIRSIPAQRRVAMTGTPIENHLSELWSIMDLLNPGLLGSPAEFRERFAVPIEKLGDSERAQQLRRMIKPFVLRRTKTDPQIAGELPEKMEQKIFCNLTPEQAGMYERITAEMLTQIDAATGIRRRGLILAALTRLKQVCDHPLLLLKDDGPIDGRSGKVERLIEMLEEVLDVGDAALVFTQYRQMGHIFQQAIRDRLKHEPLFLHGGTPAKARDELIERFQAGDSRIFILSLRAGGLGLNLTAANHVFHFDRWWNPAVESQATDRAYRIGQTRKVQVHKFICVGTMEERIDKLLTDKVALADRIVTTGDEWLTNLSTEELRNYLSLTSDAVGDF